MENTEVLTEVVEETAQNVAANKHAFDAKSGWKGFFIGVGVTLLVDISSAIVKEVIESRRELKRKQREAKAQEEANNSENVDA